MRSDMIKVGVDKAPARGLCMRLDRLNLPRI